MEHFFRTSNGIETVRVERALEPNRFIVTLRDQSLSVLAQLGEDGRIDLRIDDRPVRAYVARDGNNCLIQLLGELPTTLEVLDSPREKRKHGAGRDSSLTANTPAQVVNVLVSAGAAVKQGDPLVVLEAMKMEFRIAAPRDGVVTSVGCQVGDVVERGQVLVELGEPQP